jgi:hypothetical protein
MKVTNDLHVQPRLRISGAVRLHPICFHGLHRDDFNVLYYNFLQLTIPQYYSVCMTLVSYSLALRMWTATNMRQHESTNHHATKMVERDVKQQ